MKEQIKTNVIVALVVGVLAFAGGTLYQKANAQDIQHAAAAIAPQAHAQGVAAPLAK